MSEDHAAVFREEAFELLGELESSLLSLEESPEDSEIIGRVFRAMHTIKGSGAMFGFDAVAAFTHEVETVFDLVRKGEMAVTKPLVDATLAARDRIRIMLDISAGGESETERAETEALVARFRAMVPSAPGVAEEPKAEGLKRAAGEEKVTAEPAPELVTYRIRFRPPEDMFRRGSNPVSLLAELQELGDLRIVAMTDGIPPLEVVDPEKCYLSWDAVLTTGRGENAIRDVFIFVDEPGVLTIDVIDSSGNQPSEGDYKKLGDILMERGDLVEEKLRAALGKQKRLGELLVESGIVRPGQVRSALVEQKIVKEQREKRQAAENAASVRVPAGRLDVLVNLVGELVTVQARFSQAAAERSDSELVAVAEEVERLIADLRDNVMNIRMLPIGTSFAKFRRLLRDLSAELGKEIDLATEGEDTELDKTVIDKLNDPLVHIIRNSIDHGIELPSVRESAGKPRRGTIRLSAIHSGAHVLIRIEDDGAGLDKEAIRAKAAEKGLIPPGAQLSDKELFNLILLPGFSTAKKVSSVSGRGVGMDVVKQAIDVLRGTIDIASVRGQGSVITIKLPLTLAIIDGFLVSVGDGYFVLPLASVSECVELSHAETEGAHGRHIANVRGQIVPYIRLRDRFAIEGERPQIEHIVITEFDETRVGFVVDRVVGEHQTVIKSLGRIYSGIQGISGATILGDGTVALILDIQRIAREVEDEEVGLPDARTISAT
ncbi:MAG TPA: chemotaxis protein CheA [Candidatus Deferrimicrobiaceae bacterium]|jgi:two-component system chemotaxis sensor kinase CheA